MRVGILVTDNGPHSAAQWAEATAGSIVDIADHVSGVKRGAAIKLQAAIIDILEKYHEAVQAGERMFIVNDASHCTSPLSVSNHTDLDTAVTEVIVAAAGTPWESDFATAEMKSGLRTLLDSHFSTAMDIERQYHADRNPSCPHGQAYKASITTGGN